MTDSSKPVNENIKDQSSSAEKWKKIAEEAELTDNETDTKSPESVEPAELDFPSRQQLEDQLTAKERQINDFKLQAQRIQAELENIRRRAERDVSNAHKYSIEQLVRALLPAMDALMKGLEVSDFEDVKTKKIQEGMQLTLDIMQGALTKFGVEIIDPALGDDFNPTMHEAMALRSDPAAKPNTIIQVLQKGYSLHGRVLRAAMVIVAQP